MATFKLKTTKSSESAATRREKNTKLIAKLSQENKDAAEGKIRLTTQDKKY